uniref:K2 n=1 Tax=Arundo donax TaxID=35708 RepID=A0A0A9MZF2_ARUDO
MMKNVDRYLRVILFLSWTRSWVLESMYARKKVSTMSTAKKRSTTMSATSSPPLGTAFMNATSNGYTHAEYATRITMNVSQHLYLELSGEMTHLSEPPWNGL